MAPRKPFSGTIKASALIGREGVGAIVEEGSLAYVVAPLDWWTPHGTELGFDTPQRILELLGKAELRRLSFSADEDERRRTSGMVPQAVRFPRSVICMSCDRMYVGGSGNHEQTCRACRSKGRPAALFGANWIMVCHRGHADDVWWAGLAHRDLIGSSTGRRTNCKSELDLYLTSRRNWARLLASANSSEVEPLESQDSPAGGFNMYTNQVIGCLDCGSASDLSTLRSAASGMKPCRSRDPWGQDLNELRSSPHCAWPILRSSTQVIQVSGASFLDLESGDAHALHSGEDVPAVMGWQRDVDDEPLAHGYREQVLRKSDPAERERLAERFAGAELKRIDWSAETPSLEDLAMWMRGEAGVRPSISLESTETGLTEGARYQSEEDYQSRMQEWRVLESGNARRESLVLETKSASGSAVIQSLSAVARFREIRVPLGYTRVNATRPEAAGHACKNPGSCNEPPQRRGVGDNPLPWLPAHEVFGEGIFIGFNPAMINNVVTDERYAERHSTSASELGGNPLLANRLDLKMLLAPSFPLVHAFSHLLIKELAFVAGYSLPSLRERIYVDTNGAQAGLLVYTADGDSEGSLGGLVRLAQAERIERLIQRLVLRNSWCPQDPICWESNHSGALGLNRSTCHGCTIIPETSCAHSNLRLDRRAIVDPHFGMQRWIAVPGGRRG